MCKKCIESAKEYQRKIRQKIDATVSDMIQKNNDFIEAILSGFTVEQRYKLALTSAEIIGGIDVQKLVKERRRNVRKRNHLRRKNTKRRI